LEHVKALIADFRLNAEGFKCDGTRITGESLGVVSLINLTNPRNLNSALLRTLYSKIATVVGDAHFCIF